MDAFIMLGEKIGEFINVLRTSDTPIGISWLALLSGLLALSLIINFIIGLTNSVKGNVTGKISGDVIKKVKGRFKNND